MITLIGILVGLVGFRLVFAGTRPAGRSQPAPGRDVFAGYGAHA